MGIKWDDKTKEDLKTHLKNISGILVEYLRGTVIDSLIIFAINLVFMLIMKMPFSILISIVVRATTRLWCVCHTVHRRAIWSG